ncbi:16059_t:CDS:2 [Funneliformis geosporum]|uniref:Leucine carboxyl methyltransferase 1 n=1 Tax=Funneliformis geosporum TaxID=1117311 RepID=A0A9W4WNE0_9GLOM|nr:16059_t:CDS:2 [Funneliformis geosporum]CAI2166762.1 4448_t:CDS:2 [Funneliformis geosporum]
MAFRTPPTADTSSQDNAIRGTNDDAVTSKLSAVTTGYINDVFVKYFVKRPSKRPPIINRGSYVRNAGLDILITKFLEVGEGNLKKQIVSLGAGSDTRYFHFKITSRNFHKYFEIDFPEITSKKVAIIRRNNDLLDLIGTNMQIGKGGTEIYAPDYCLMSGDLRSWADNLVPRLKEHGFDQSIPTLFLSECVLIYMDPIDSNKIVQWVGDNMKLAMFIVFEQILPNDPFGSVMLQNLRAINIELRGIYAYPDLQSQKDRYLLRGWTHAEAVDINEIHDKHIDSKELFRISKLEFLDELEEWRLLAAHYCIAWAYSVKDALDESLFDNVKFDNYERTEENLSYLTYM